MKKEEIEKILNNKKLGWNDRCFLLFLLLKPEGWKVSNEKIAKELNCHPSTVANKSKQLKNAGLLKKARLTDAKGRFKGWKWIILSSEGKELKIIETGNISKKADGKGYVYLLKSKDLYKIGITENIQGRIRHYRTSNPFGIDLLFQGKVRLRKRTEDDLNNRFERKRVKGEWFKLNKEDVSTIKSILNSRENNI